MQGIVGNPLFVLFFRLTSHATHFGTESSVPMRAVAGDIFLGLPVAKARRTLCTRFAIYSTPPSLRGGSHVDGTGWRRNHIEKMMQHTGAAVSRSGGLQADCYIMRLGVLLVTAK